VEGPLLAAQEGGQGLGVAEVQVAGSRPAEGQYETLHPLPTGLLEAAPIDLALAPGRGLKSDRGFLRNQRPQRLQKLPKDAQAALVAKLSSVVEEHGRVGDLVRTQHAVQQVVAEGVELGG
jgi:hypothetical protein